MGKPAVVMFVGVEEFSTEDESLLPSDVRKIFQERTGAITLGDIIFECIDDGCPDSADSGNFAGFGVVFYRAWWDSGIVDYHPVQIAQKAVAILAQVQSFFTLWDLDAKPRTLTCCVYR